MVDEYILNHPSYQYAQSVVNGEVIAGKYIIKECESFLSELENPDSKYVLDVETIKLIDGLTSLLNMADGLNIGESVSESLAGFQWYFLINILAWKHKDDLEKRRYEKAVLLIARKSGKSFLVSVIFVMLLLIEPANSEFYSVAPDRELSSIVKKEMEKTIKTSPLITDRFKIIRSEITCLLNNSKMIALATSDNRMDGNSFKSAVLKSGNIGGNLLYLRYQ